MTSSQVSLRVDMQTHSRHSQLCGWTSPSKLIRSAVATGLDGIALTDHNTMDGVAEARAASPPDFHIIPAEEIDTSNGQIIGLFLDDPIDPWQDAVSVLSEIHEQGGLAFAPHPFDSYREGLETIDALAEELDAIETLNSRCVRAQFNNCASAFARDAGLPELGGSDAHFAHEVGTAYTDIKLSGRSETVPTDREEWLTAVRTAIVDGTVGPGGGRGSMLNHVGTKLVKFASANLARL